MLKKLLSSSSHLPGIPSEATEIYAASANSLVAKVNSLLDRHPQRDELIGRNPVTLMHDNHRNHVDFMTTVFRLNSYELLARTLPWIYRAYHARGFSYDYFLEELRAWKIAVLEAFGETTSKHEILAVYDWMIQHHAEVVSLAESGEGLAFSVDHETTEIQQIFLSLLLHGDGRGCLKLIDQSIQTPDELKKFYLDIVWPSLYTIGKLWETDQISVAEEHLATAIVGRVMAALYPRFMQVPISRGRALVSACPNEFHEVGARMVADFLELDGWDVTFLGANTPASEIVSILKRQKSFFIALSVATIFNLDKARQLIELIRADAELSGIKILIGGLAFQEMTDLWQQLGADACAPDAQQAVDVADRWWLAAGAG